MSDAQKMTVDMMCIVGKEVPVFFQIVSEFKKQVRILIALFEEGSAEEVAAHLPLGQVEGCLSGIAVVRTGRDFVVSVHVGGDILVDGRILLRQIEIILIVRVEIFQFPVMDGDLQNAGAALDL